MQVATVSILGFKLQCETMSVNPDNNTRITTTVINYIVVGICHVPLKVMEIY